MIKTKANIKNLGGRHKLVVGTRTRVLDCNCHVSQAIYTIDSPTTDTHARATLKNGDNIIQVHYNRLLPVEALDKAIVVVADKKLVVSCPKCSKVSPIDFGQRQFNCCSTLETHYMPEAELLTEAQRNDTFDLNALKSEFEIWVKEGAKFGESIALTAVQLILLEGDEPRKMTFNLYDNKVSTNGRGKGPRIEEFRSGILEEGKGKFWHKVDKTKYQKKLQNSGYRKLD